MATSTPNLGLRKPDPADLVNVETDLNENFDKLDAPVYSAAAATTEVVKAQVDADTHDRFHLRADGRLAWGPGNADQDVELWRDSAGVLRTAGGLIIGGALTLSGGLTLPAGSIETADLADGAVTSAKILDGTIATGDIADNAITTAKILNGTILNEDIADGTITAAKLATSVLLADIEHIATTWATDTITSTSFLNVGTALEMAAADRLYIIALTSTINPLADGDIGVLSFRIRRGNTEGGSSEILAAADSRALRSGNAEPMRATAIYFIPWGSIDDIGAGSFLYFNASWKVSTGTVVFTDPEITVLSAAVNFLP